ncbi:hypothetical protein JAAARDRAFT_111255, partial [Jaapia argillacea MUCL 33604]
DSDGPKVTDTFYGHLFPKHQSTQEVAVRLQPDLSQAAYAVHLATGKLRSEGCPLVRWVPFIHLG